jgi:hypothetical protein
LPPLSAPIARTAVKLATPKLSEILLHFQFLPLMRVSYYLLTGPSKQDINKPKASALPAACPVPGAIFIRLATT